MSKLNPLCSLVCFLFVSRLCWYRWKKNAKQETGLMVLHSRSRAGPIEQNFFEWVCVPRDHQASSTNAPSKKLSQELGFRGGCGWGVLDMFSHVIYLLLSSISLAILSHGFCPSCNWPLSSSTGIFLCLPGTAGLICLPPSLALHSARDPLGVGGESGAFSAFVMGNISSKGSTGCWVWPLHCVS